MFTYNVVFVSSAWRNLAVIPDLFIYLFWVGVGGSGGGGGCCNVQLADEIMLVSIISLIFIFAHAPVLSNLIYTKHAQ